MITEPSSPWQGSELAGRLQPDGWSGEGGQIHQLYGATVSRASILPDMIVRM